jgi:hypothetical protein
MEIANDPKYLGQFAEFGRCVLQRCSFPPPTAPTHRTTGVAELLPTARTDGPKPLHTGKRRSAIRSAPVVAVVMARKCPRNRPALGNLIDKVDSIVIGG